MFAPANKKLRETILIALMQSSDVSPESPNTAENGAANISAAASPTSIIIAV